MYLCMSVYVCKNKLLCSKISFMTFKEIADVLFNRDICTPKNQNEFFLKTQKFLNGIGYRANS